MSKTSVFVKATLIAAVVALGFSSVAFAKGRVAKAPAAPAASTQQSTQLVQTSWKSELARLSFDNLVIGRLDRIFSFITRRLDKNFSSKHRDDRFPGKLEITVNEVETLLSKAEAIASTHAGFDASGSVTDQAQALKSVQTLGADLAELRGTLIHRLEHIV